MTEEEYLDQINKGRECRVDDESYGDEDQDSIMGLINGVHDDIPDRLVIEDPGNVKAEADEEPLPF